MNCAYAERSTARREIRPPAWKGLLNASVLDFAMMVLSRSKNAAVRPGAIRFDMPPS